MLRMNDGWMTGSMTTNNNMADFVRTAGRCKVDKRKTFKSITFYDEDTAEYKPSGQDNKVSTDVQTRTNQSYSQETAVTSGELH
eukprot:4179883-Amphidinium_carterae.1